MKTKEGVGWGLLGTGEEAVVHVVGALRQALGGKQGRREGKGRRGQVTQIHSLKS